MKCQIKVIPSHRLYGSQFHLISEQRCHQATFSIILCRTGGFQTVCHEEARLSEEARAFLADERKYHRDELYLKKEEKWRYLYDDVCLFNFSKF